MTGSCRFGADQQIAGDDHSYLKRLERLTYISKVEPLEPGGKAKSRAYWKIADPYFRLWFRFVLPNSSRLGRSSPLGGSATAVGSWWSRRSDVEIDVVALDKRCYTLLGSCKWWDDLVGESVLDDLIDARAVIGPQARQAELALFSKLGFTNGLAARAQREHVHLFTAADLFA